ncbi:membrane protein suppressor for copper-sensitivity ScsB [Vibrio maritimus]|uniref:Membrane protein suppressor for copper-sensitivity ScsB n=1 Tax=Vibrio maritimus TaxID=990268 RepID=A0A090RRJ1_9VIBR|nr:membrane protein suppressor for copper-sensitivity ScsB [Vibrio maritimus]
MLDVELDGEWKTYWRSPGEGGVALNLIGATQPMSTTSNGIGPYPPIMSN